MPQRAVVSRDAMIAGYSRNGLAEKASETVKQMQLASIKRNSTIFHGILPATLKWKIRNKVTLKKQVEKTQEEMKILNSMGIGDKTVADCLKEMKEVVGNSEAQVEYAKKVESMEKQVKQIKDNMEKDNRDEDIKSLHKKVKRLEATVKKIGEQCLISLKAYCGHAQILMDKLEVINKEKDSSVVEKMGPGSRTRASARKKSPKDDKETEELKTSVNNMQLMVLEAEEMVKEM